MTRLDLDLVRDALPAYEIGGELGRGGWGVVLDGRHRHLDRQVAIKQLPRAFAADPNVRTRFAGEAKVLASLDHPHIVPVFDYVESEGLCLLVMEKLSGGTLWSRFTKSGLTPEASCAVVLATCAGLHAAHLKGVLHRDIKPENLLFSESGALKVADFGIAKVVGGEDVLMTKAGEVLGTPAYMAPEQAQGGELGATTDVYATAVMLYELLSGTLPFPEDSDPLTTLYRHVHEEPVPLTEAAPTIPKEIALVVMKALAREASHRYQTAEDFGVALAEAATGVWTPGWPVNRGEVTVMGSPSIVAATERASWQAVQEIRPPAPPTVKVSALAPMRVSAVVRAADLGPGEAERQLAPVRELVSRPPVPRPVVARAVGLAAIAALLGVTGWGGVPPRGNVEPGTWRLDGADVATTDTVTVDLDTPIEITGAPGAVDPAPATLRLDLSLLGIPLGSGEADVMLNGDQLEGRLDLTGSRYLAGGRFTGTLSTESGQERRFRIGAERSAMLTLPGLAVVAGLLFLAAYFESVLKLLRRGRRLRAGHVAVVILGIATGPALALIAAFVARREPGALALALSAALGGAAGYAAGAAAVAVGRFRRLARARRT